MIRSLNIIMTLTSVLGLVGVYALKYSAEDTARTKLNLEQTIQRQEADLSLLKADWAALNQPSHLEPIIQRHAEALGIAPLKQTQIGGFSQLPMRPAEPDSAALTALLNSLQAGVDPADAPLDTSAQ